MTTRDRDHEKLLDRALDEIRAAEPPPEQARAACERVWQALSHTAAEARRAADIRSCADFQRLLPDHSRGELDGSRKLLVEDHLGECVPCRRAFRELRRGAARPAVAERSQRSSLSRWVARGVAAAAIFVAIVGVSFETDVFSFETGGLVHVEHVVGELFRVTEAGVVPVVPGEELTLGEGQGVRTAKGSSAVLRLADDSRVEMRERSELEVRTKRFLLPGRRADGMIDLGRGSVIVEASDQGSGHLFLRTDDCLVSVTGTVFSVNHGVKGSRVSVIEGQVEVEHAGAHNVLLPGQQATTHPTLARVPVAQEIAWSAQRERYVALLREFQALGDEIDQVLRPGLRYSTQLIDLAPSGTVVYFAMPNLAGELSEAYGVLQTRIAENALLESWWGEHVTPEAAEHLERAIDKVAAYGEHLGEEVALTLQLDQATGEVGPLFLAVLEHPSAFIDMIEAELDGEAGRHVRLIRDGVLPAQLQDGPSGQEGEPELTFWIRGALLAATDEPERLRQLEAAAVRPGASLAGSPFAAQLIRPYDRGVEWLVGVDVGRLVRPDDGADPELIERLGLLDARYIIGERRQLDRVTENRIVLSFSQERRSMAAWLDEPAQLGALDYVSPTARLAVGFAMKDMELIVAELFDLLSTRQTDFESGLETFQREHGIDIRKDFAAALGGELVVALDGPLFPKPAVIFVMEVYDAERLERSIALLANQFTAHVRTHGGRGIGVESSVVGTRTFHLLDSLDTGFELHYTFDDGYVLFATSRGELQRALTNREMGLHLTDSPKFRALLPPDGQSNFSGVFYHDLGPVLGSVAGLLGIDPASPMGQELLAGDGGSKPLLAVFYGERDRIVAASMSEGGLLGASFRSLSGLGSLLSLPQQVFEHAPATAGGDS